MLAAEPVMADWPTLCRSALAPVTLCEIAFSGLDLLSSRACPVGTQVVHRERLSGTPGTPDPLKTLRIGLAA